MLLPLFAALTMGGCVGALTLWYTGWGVAAGIVPSERLNRIKNAEEAAPASTAANAIFRLRRRTNLRFGGVNLVSSKAAEKWRLQLERAGMSLNVREYFLMRIAVSVAFVLVGTLFLPAKEFALLLAPAGYFLVGKWLNRKISKRTQTMESQLVELLQMLASGLRAGFGLMQALESAADQLQPPLSIELRKTLRDTAMGSSLEKSLKALNDRVGSADFDIVITAIMIQRSVGGNLAEILDNVAHTMRERERIRGEIRTLTSQQRLTGYVIGCIPIGLLVIFSIISRDFVGVLYTDSLGRMMLMGAGIMEFFGFMIIRKIVDIEV
jgi:tight adherence protein B